MNSLLKNGPIHCTTHARACAREDANESLMRSDILVLIQEVVSMLAIQGSSQGVGNSSKLKRATCWGPHPKHRPLQVFLDYCMQSIRSYIAMHT